VKLAATQDAVVGPDLSPRFEANRTPIKNRRRGHGPKIEAAARRLWPDGEIPSWLRPIDIFRRLESELKRMGCTASEMPSESSLKRWYARRQAESSGSQISTQAVE
jgi:hypothetical protein